MRREEFFGLGRKPFLCKETYCAVRRTQHGNG